MLDCKQRVELAIRLNTLLQVLEHVTLHLLVHGSEELAEKRTCELETLLAEVISIILFSSAKRYLKEMMTTIIEWRQLSPGDLLPGEAEREQVFTLLSQADFYKVGRENWVRWWYPPAIKRQMLDPERWAQILWCCINYHNMHIWLYASLQ